MMICNKFLSRSISYQYSSLWLRHVLTRTKSYLNSSWYKNVFLFMLYYWYILVLCFCRIGFTLVYTTTYLNDSCFNRILPWWFSANKYCLFHNTQQHKLVTIKSFFTNIYLRFITYATDIKGYLWGSST